MQPHLLLLIRLLLLIPMTLGTVTQPVLASLSHTHQLATHGVLVSVDAAAFDLHEERHAEQPWHALTHHAHACGYTFVACTEADLHLNVFPKSERPAIEPTQDFVSARSRALLKPPRVA